MALVTGGGGGAMFSGCGHSYSPGPGSSVMSSSLTMGVVSQGIQHELTDKTAA